MHLLAPVSHDSMGEEGDDLRPITNPNPPAPPVTTPTLPCSENVASVGTPLARLKAGVCPS